MTGPQGLFIETSHGRIFCIRYGAGPHCALLISPFAEEMNRTRRMWTLLAQALAERGMAVLIPDLHGTGESDGDFAEARWKHWLEDLTAASNQALADGSTRLTVVGLRLGALLGLEFAQRHPVERVVLWQPVLSGQQFMTQFLRLKLAAGLRAAAGPKHTTNSLRQQLARGESLEVAGYEVRHELVDAIDAVRIEQLASSSLPPISWLEVSRSEPPALMPASAAMVEALRADGVRIDAQALRGEPFWALPEITVAPELVASTVRIATAPAA